MQIDTINKEQSFILNYHISLLFKCKKIVLSYQTM